MLVGRSAVLHALAACTCAPGRWPAAGAWRTAGGGRSARARPRTQVQAGRAAQQPRRRIMAQAPARRGQPAPAAPAGRRGCPGRRPSARRSRAPARGRAGGLRAQPARGAARGRVSAGISVGGGARRAARLAPRPPARAGGVGAGGARVRGAWAGAGGGAPAVHLQEDQVAAAPARRRARAASLRNPGHNWWRARCLRPVRALARAAGRGVRTMRRMRHTHSCWVFGAPHASLNVGHSVLLVLSFCSTARRRGPNGKQGHLVCL